MHHFLIREYERANMKQGINERLHAFLSTHTEDDLADAIGISRPTLDARLSGRIEWSWREVVRIASLVGCSLDELA